MSTEHGPLRSVPPPPEAVVHVAVADSVVAHLATAMARDAGYEVTERPGDATLVIGDDARRPADVLVVPPHPAPAQRGLAGLTAGTFHTVLCADHLPQLADGLASVAAGFAVCSRHVVDLARRMPPLSARQRALLVTLSTGCTADEVADQLGYSSATIRRELTQLSRLLDVRGRGALVSAAFELGLDGTTRRP